MEIQPESEDAIMQALEVLKSGGVVAHATETCYGLACDLSNQNAVERLFTMKERPEYQPVSALFVSVKNVKEYVDWNDTAEKLAEEHLPGPLTIILPLSTDGLHKLYPTPKGSGSLGIRISKHPLAQTLVKLFGLPISTTSANISGEPSLYSAEDLVQKFGESLFRPDFLIDSGKISSVATSTVVDVTGDKLHIVRRGDIEVLE